MRLAESRFTNEYGNLIVVTVARTGRLFTKHIKLTIKGPNSTHENTVTLREAEEMRDALAVAIDYLKRGPK